MILVDTSVLINFFRGKETVGTAYFEKLLEEQKHFCINEFIYQEILQGSKDEKEFAVLKSYLINVPLYSLKRGIQSFENAALLNFRCRRKGVTIRSTVDLLIAETAIENNIPLLHDDDDFANMARIITELKLVVQMITPNTRFNADICFVMEIAWAVAAGAAPFFMQLSRQLCRHYASAKAQMQVKRMLDGRFRRKRKDV